MTGALVGFIEPPSGSAVTSTCSTPFRRPRWISTSALPLGVGAEERRRRRGVLVRALEPHLVDLAARRRGHAAHLELGRVVGELQRRAGRRRRRDRTVPVTVLVSLPPDEDDAADHAGGDERRRRPARPAAGAAEQRPAPPASRRTRGRRRGGLVGARLGGVQQLGLGAHDGHDAARAARAAARPAPRRAAACRPRSAGRRPRAGTPRSVARCASKRSCSSSGSARRT